MRSQGRSKVSADSLRRCQATPALPTAQSRVVTVPLLQKLHGKVAIITGGASGIGAFTARHFADHGALAVVIADVQDAKGKALAASIGSHRCTYVYCDVTDEDQVKSLVDSTVAQYGQLDVMYSNAGINGASAQMVLELDLSEYDKVMAVNARGMAACVKHAARAMVEKGVKGSIVCTASFVADCGTESLTDYTMSKHAVLGLVRSASVQLAPRCVRVNCVSPGMVATPLACNILKISAEELGETMTAVYAERDEPLTAKHVADAGVFLASEDSAFVTGHNLVVDGGLGTKSIAVLKQL
ncbi:(-)-isopiperitenol/(-)-carveol dehydrogenase, mitochondrial-like [Argentina anserina]|uniref:(-)-isopiperitenol/(-)-carveol dehydrogenase, mitochondrial-like n=1 Tax=Argentina anserina TaxID=57926 RepID=UPI002176668B|nr:(-)-isopiperitenol/(-)-carveol dehydrogenase, mitochondrial-like [Potentilla anserina]